MNQNTPNSELALWWPILAALLIEWSKKTVPEVQPSITGGTVHPGLAVGKGQRLWEELKNKTDSKQIKMKLERTFFIHFPHYVNSPWLSVASGESLLMRSSPLILIPCIITFDLIIDSIKSIYFHNLDVTNIYWNKSNDIYSKFLLLSGINIEGDQNSTMENIVFTSSTVSFMMVGGIQNNSTVGYFFDIKNITLTDLTYSQSKALIQFNQFSYQVNLTFTFTNWMFSNIQFENSGKLFLLGGRMYTPVIISSSTFQNLSAATIQLNPQEISDKTIIDMLNISDSAFDNINSASDSFIVAFEHGRVTVHRWTFTNMYSYESGAVMYGAYDDTQFYLYDSSFINNTSVRGSIFLFDNYAVAHIYNWTIKNNFFTSFRSCIYNRRKPSHIFKLSSFKQYSNINFSSWLIRRIFYFNFQ